MNFTVNVIVVCNSGLSTAVLLKQRLHMIVPELNVISTCRVSDVIKEAENINPDFIISTTSKCRRCQCDPKEPYQFIL